MRRLTPQVLSLIWAVGACSHPVTNTIPAPAGPTAATRYYDLEIPAGLEIKNIMFDATTFADVSGYQTGNTGYTSSSVGGRAFLKVYAVHRDTGEQFLLIYEDIAGRKRPLHIVRFHSVPEQELPLKPSP
jgi:hypothetical protein